MVRPEKGRSLVTDRKKGYRSGYYVSYVCMSHLQILLRSAPFNPTMDTILAGTQVTRNLSFKILPISVTHGEDIQMLGKFSCLVS